MWINKFKIAIAQKDTDAIDKLLNDIPEFSTLEEAQTASHLMREAVTLLYTLQDEVSASMKQIKKNIKFLGSSLSDGTGSLNIRS